MELVRHQDSGLIEIQTYGEQTVTIDDQVYTRSICFTPQGPVTAFDHPPPEDLAVEHADRLLEMKPEVVILATGERTVFPPAAFAARLGRAGVGLEAMDLGAACRTYAVLASEGRQVLAALLLAW